MVLNMKVASLEEILDIYYLKIQFQRETWKEILEVFSRNFVKLDQMRRSLLSINTQHFANRIKSIP